MKLFSMVLPWRTWMSQDRISLNHEGGDCKCRWLDIVPFLCIQDSRVGEWWLRALSESLQKHELPFWSERIRQSIYYRQAGEASRHNYCHGLALFLSTSQANSYPQGREGLSVTSTSTHPLQFTNFCLFPDTNVGNTRFVMCCKKRFSLVVAFSFQVWGVLARPVRII